MPRLVPPAQPRLPIPAPAVPALSDPPGPLRSCRLAPPQVLTDFPSQRFPGHPHATTRVISSRPSPSDVPTRTHPCRARLPRPAQLRPHQCDYPMLAATIPHHPPRNDYPRQALPDWAIPTCRAAPTRTRLPAPARAIGRPFPTPQALRSPTRSYTRRQPTPCHRRPDTCHPDRPPHPVPHRATPTCQYRPLLLSPSPTCRALTDRSLPDSPCPYVPFPVTPPRLANPPLRAPATPQPAPTARPFSARHDNPTEGNQQWPASSPSTTTAPTPTGSM